MRRWPLVVLLALAPLWLVGMLWRGAWTPDEPREADIVWRMSLQSDRTLPQLADTPFLEKPPLSYWASAAAIELLGDSPAVARIPNIGYAIVGALALGALAFAMESATAAVVTVLVAGTALTALRVTIWLAPDAGLLAGCTLALWGAWLGYTGTPGRRKLFGYTLMHAGAAIGFMAKSAPGWLVPALALLTLILWERRWAELGRWELYVGLVVQALFIGPWLYEVARTAEGATALRTLFWNNVVGRFTVISAPAALDYTRGHRNLPGKYLLELPVYLLPWTLLVVAAARRAWDRVRVRGSQGTAWRFAVSAIVPFLVLLSVAATARDVYAAPVLPACALLVGLWLAEPALGREGPLLTPLNRFAHGATRLVVLLIASLLAGAMLILALSGSASSAVHLLLNAVAVLAVAILCLRLSAQSQAAGDTLQSFSWTYTAHAAALTLSALALFPIMDRWQDLPSLAQRIHDDARGRPLAVLQPDETTIAMLDHRLQTPLVTLTSQTGDLPASLVASWFRGEGAQALVLVKLPGRQPGPLEHFLAHLRPIAPPDDEPATTLVNTGVAAIAHRYELPEGRRYVLLGPGPGAARP